MTFEPLESMSCTVMVDVDVPSAVIEEVPAVIVEVVVEGPLTVKVTEPVVALLYESSAAFVAEIVHAPPDVYERVEPDSEQEAVPAATREYDTAPLPEPPVIARAVVPPSVAEVAAKLRVAWLARDTATAKVLAPELMVPSDAEMIADSAL